MNASSLTPPDGSDSHAMDKSVQTPRLLAVHQLWGRCLGALSILATLALMEFYVIRSEATLLRRTVLVTNLSDQQRARVTRMGILTVDLAGARSPDEREAKRQQLRDELRDYHQAHLRLLNGSPDLELPPPPQRVQQVLFAEPMNLSRRVDDYLAWYSEVLEVPPEQLARHRIWKRFRDQAIGDKLMDGLEALVGAWQHENEAQLARLETTANVGVGAMFVTLILTGAFVFAPMVRRVRAEASQLFLANEKLNEQTQMLQLENQQRAAINAQLRESEERVELALNSALDAVITLDEQGRITKWSPQAELIFGWSLAEALGRSLAEMIIPPRYRSAHTAGIAEFLSTGYGPAFHRRLELFAIRRNGEEFPIELSLAPLRLRDGFEFCGFLRDITERRQSEQALKSFSETLEQRVAERSGFVKLLQDVADIANETESVETALQAALDLIARYMNWPIGQAFLPDPREPGRFRHASLWTLPENSIDVPEDFREQSAMITFHAGEGPLGQVVATRQPNWIEDLTSGHAQSLLSSWLPLQVASSISFPILVNREVVAVLQFFCRQLARPDQSLVEVLAHVGAQLGRVVERRRFQEQLLDAVWQQQQQLGQELHDSLGQELTGLAMMADGLEQKLRTAHPESASRAAELTHYLRQAQGRVREMARGLFPVDVTADGLATALSDLTATVQKQGRIECEFHCPPALHIANDTVATHLFRITQEALHNVVKHAQARRIVVRLTEQDSRLTLLIRDDGRGIDTARSATSGIGVRIMRCRADAIGAQIQIERAELGGTLVQCTLPSNNAPVQVETQKRILRKAGSVSPAVGG